MLLVGVIRILFCFVIEFDVDTDIDIVVVIGDKGEVLGEVKKVVEVVMERRCPFSVHCVEWHIIFVANLFEETYAWGGFGFVVYEDLESAVSAVREGGHTVSRRTLNVRFKLPRRR